MNTSRIISLLALLALVAACAKEKKYERVFRDQVSNKSLISTDANDAYIYVPSVGDAPMTVSSSIPYFMGDEKLATFRFEEGALIAEELPDDERFAENRNNRSPILRIPIEHKDYRCKEDQFGDCGNQEEEVDDRPWQSRRFFKGKYAEMEVTETNSLPDQTAAAFSRCFDEEEIVVKDVKIEQDSIFIHVQKRWEAKVVCADFENITSFAGLLRGTTYTVNYYYSFVKVKKLAAADYQPVNYPFEDQNTFGFFKRDLVRLSADGRNTLDSETNYMARWNPKREELVYYLSDDFYREDREAVRLATEQAVQTINNSLEKATINMRITLKDGRGLSPGDLRYNFLVLVNDPNATGILGYGPTVAHPRTGEIVKANTMMYYGNLTRLIEQTYDDLVAEQQRDNAARTSVGAEAIANADAATAPSAPGVSEPAKARAQHAQALFSDIQNVGRIAGPSGQRHNSGRSTSLIAGQDLATLATRDVGRALRVGGGRVELSTWLERLRDPNLSDEMRLKATMEMYSHHCLYHESNIDLSMAMSSEVNAASLGQNLKPWIQLTDSERQRIIDRLMPSIFVGTLVHELGHNLGLRHNFSGSEDTENYYSAEERRSLGISRPVTYSSVMDYAYSELNQLPVMGKYDLAALRFGYKREIEMKDGSILQLSPEQTFETLESHARLARNQRQAARMTEEQRRNAQIASNMKSFQYCTDEHVEVNPGCNRNDEGSGLLAIAQHYVRAIKKGVSKTSYRNNRARFSIVNDRAYYNRMDFYYEALRRFFETFDRFSSDPQLASMMALTPQEWDDILNQVPENVRPNVIANRNFVQGVRDAATVAVDFYLETLTMPDVHCGIAAASEPTKILGHLPLSQLTPNDNGEAFDCFDTDRIGGLREGFIPVTQVGRFFNHKRHEHLLPGSLRASADELSVRGFWLDKLVAAKWLTIRELDNTVFDEYRAAPIDYPEFGDKIRAALIGFVTDTVVTKTEQRWADGRVEVIDFTHGPSASHNIQNVVLTGFHERRGLNRVQTDFRALLLPLVKRSLRAADDVSKTLGLVNALSVTPVDATTTLNPSLVAASAEFVDAQGNLIGRYAATREQTLAASQLRLRATRKVLEGFTMEQIETAFNQLSSNTVPAEIPENLRPLYQVPKELMQAFANQALPTDEFLIPLMRAMALPGQTNSVNVNINVGGN